MSLVLLSRDLAEIVVCAESDLRALRRSRLYVTGGTGFFGRWFCRTISEANRVLDTRIRLCIISRDPRAFEARAPDLMADECIEVLRGDVARPPTNGSYDGVVHAATAASASLNRDDPEEMLRVVVDGTRAVIDGVVRPNGQIPVLFTSSGAVYGRTDPNMQLIPETYYGGPDCLNVGSAYHEGKRFAELLLAVAARSGIGTPKIARLFAFLGPGLPLDLHFAAGNFIRDALNGKSISVRGNGQPYRSYLYPVDMIAWCLAIFVRGHSARAYNVGSDVAITIAELAAKIGSAAVSPVNVEIGAASENTVKTDYYVPDISRVTSELGVSITVSLDDAIARTLANHMA